MSAPITASNNQKTSFDYWDEKFASIEETLPNLSITEDEREIIRSELTVARSYLSGLEKNAPLDNGQVDYFNRSRTNMVEAMRRGSFRKMQEVNRHNHRMEMVGKAGEIGSYVGIGVGITILTAGTGTAVAGTLITGEFVSAGTASIIGTSVATLGGSAIGSGTYALESGAEDVWAGRDIDSQKMKKKAVMGAVEGGMAAFGPSAGRAVFQTLAAKEVLTTAERFGIGVGQTMIDGIVSGAGIEGSRSVVEQIYDEGKSWDELNWSHAAKSAGIGALAGAVIGPLMHAGMGVLGKIVRKFLPKSITSHQVASHEAANRQVATEVTDRAPKAAQTLEEGIEAISSYSPNPGQIREVPGGIKVVRAEGRRPIPHVVAEDPKFKELHGNGGQNLHERLPHHRVLQVLDYLGIKLTKDKTRLENLNPADGGYVTKIQNRLADDLDEETIKKVLKFFGVNGHTEDAWQQQIRWFKAGWTGKERHVTDIDDTVVDNYNIHWADLFPTVAPLKIAAALLHLATPLDFGGVNYLAQARPQAYEIARVLRTGETIPVKTDNFKRMLFEVYRRFPGHKFAHTFKLPYQRVHYVEDVHYNPSIRTASEQAIALEKLRDLVRAQAWKGLSDDLKRTVAIATFHPKGYKMKLRTLDPFLNPELRNVSDSTLVDNASYYTEFGAARLGGRAVHVQDRGMSILNGNYLTGDSLGGLNLVLRKMGLARLAGLTNRVGRLNRLPGARYGMSDYLIPAIQESEGKSSHLISFNSPKPKETIKRLWELIYRPLPKNGLAPGSEVQRATVYLSFARKRSEFDAPISQAKGVIEDLKQTLLAEKLGDGKTAYEEARELFVSLSNAPLERISHPDLPRSPTSFDPPLPL
ncbi:MAG: hypothetical protein HY541_01655 [Deltaproteobacteria bacterium]|nr:hypothetical protein [Deltaproteobacteria bacterium]